MNSTKANLLNSIILIVVGGWGYFDGDGKSMTALIPVMFGVVLLLCNNGIKNQNKVIAHLAVLGNLHLSYRIVHAFKWCNRKRK